MKKQTLHILRGLSALFLSLAMIFTSVLGVANTWAGKLNDLLGIHTSSIVRSTDREDYRYTSDYASAAELLEAEKAYAAREQAEGCVVLKGMPVIEGNRVTLFGMRSGNRMQFGGSMGEVTDPASIVTLGTAMTERGFDVNPEMIRFYADREKDYAPLKASGGNIVFDYKDQGAVIHEVPVSEYDPALIGDYRDAAVIVLGRDAGESSCFYPGPNGIGDPAEFTGSPTGNIFSLSDQERDMIHWVRQQGFAKVIVLLNVGTSMEIEELKQDDGIDTIMWIGNPGAYGTYGIADLLKGTVLPSGHLADTFAVNSALSPAAQNVGIFVFDNASDIETTKNNALRASWYVAELEGIYTGYKYYETRYYDTVVGQGNAGKADRSQAVSGNVWDYDAEVSYGFGYGVEGSQFTEEIIEDGIDWSGEKESFVTVRVTNTGNRAAKHTVQLYVSAPYTAYDRANGIEKAAVQLVGYAKTGETQEKTFEDVVLLEPGKSEDIRITFNAQDFYSYDRNLEHDGKAGGWILEAGEYVFATGNGAHEAVNAVLKAQGYDRESTGASMKRVLEEDCRNCGSGETAVENRLDKADLNSLGAKEVTYLSRNDWYATFPSAVHHLTATEEMIQLLRNDTYQAEQEAASYTGPSAFVYGEENGIKAIQLIGLAYDDPLYQKVLNELTLQDYANQYIELLEEIRVIAMPTEAHADSPLGLIATIGQRTRGTLYEVAETAEGYKRFTNVYPGEPVLAATYSPLLQREYGRLIGNDALWTGYSTWFAPGMNLHRTPYNARNVGYFSEDAVLTGRASAYVHMGVHAYGVVTNAKHFAFNDQETNRDGIAVFLNEQAARENELRGFQIGIRDGGIKGLMSAFNRIGCTYVGASRELMNGILRGEWGWKGLLITDAVKSAQYFRPREASAAGNDMMLAGSNNGKTWNWNVAELEKDIVLQSRIRESYHRKLFTYVNSCLMNGIDADVRRGTNIPLWALILWILIGLSGIGFLITTGLLIRKYLSGKKEGSGGGNVQILAESIVLLFVVLSAVLHLMSHGTGYYTFGEMNSVTITILIGSCIVLALVLLCLKCGKKNGRVLHTVLAVLLCGLLSLTAILMVGDRVEGIGYCILTDYDSGHGGEEAIYRSLIGAACLILAAVYQIIELFRNENTIKTGKARRSVLAGSCAVLCAGVIAGSLLLGGLIPGAGTRTANEANNGKTYRILFCQENENVDSDVMPDYQFLTANMGGILRAESRMYVNVELTLKDDGKYGLFAEGYIASNGKRTQIGDDTGFGMIYQTKAEGSYVTNEDGTVTTSAAEHAAVEIKTDTKSIQIKPQMKLNIGGSDAEGLYDSAEYPEVLDFVPETIWELSEDGIITYRNPAAEEEEKEPEVKGNAEPDASVAAKEVPSDDGATSMTFRADGTFRFFFEKYNLSEEGTYTFENGVLTVINPNGAAVSAEGNPLKLHYVTAKNDQLTGDYTLPASTFDFQPAGETAEAEVASDDGATSMTFRADGTFRFFFEKYNLSEEGTYTFENGVLTVINPNGAAVSAEGDPLKLHYVTAKNDQLTGDYTLPASTFDFQPAGEPAEAEVASDDGATSMTFRADGTFRFFFEKYNLSEEGTYTFEDGILTVINPNGAAVSAEGDPLKLHYVTAKNDQLTGDYTLPASAFDFQPAGEPAEAEVASDDGATSMTFRADGTFRFFFEKYNLSEEGTYTFEDGILTVINPNGAAASAEGDPLKLHYVTAKNDQLTGDYTLPASTFDFRDASEEAEDISGFDIPSDDGATVMTFRKNGTYVFSFEKYNLSEEGTYTFQDGALEVTNPNGVTACAEGDPLKLHYVTAKNDQLTGDYTITADLFQ